LIPNFAAQTEGITVDEIIRRVVAAVPADAPPS
jgi:hypothetical protein